MAETKVENRICQECNAEVRPGSLFCYGCGSSLPVRLDADDKPKNVYETGKLDFNGKFENESGTLKSAGAINKPIEKPTALPLEDKAAIAGKKTVAQELNNLKAAPARQKAKMTGKNKVEVVWEEPDTKTNVWFSVATLILLLFAVGILVAAYYVG